MGNFHFINTEKNYEINEAAEDKAALLPETAFSEIFEVTNDEKNDHSVDINLKLAEEKVRFYFFLF